MYCTSYCFLTCAKFSTFVLFLANTYKYLSNLPNTDLDIYPHKVNLFDHEIKPTI